MKYPRDKTRFAECQICHRMKYAEVFDIQGTLMCASCQLDLIFALIEQKGIYLTEKEKEPYYYGHRYIINLLEERGINPWEE